MKDETYVEYINCYSLLGKLSKFPFPFTSGFQRNNPEAGDKNSNKLAGEEESLNSKAKSFPEPLSVISILSGVPHTLCCS